MARDRAVEAVHLRCDHNVDATYEIALGILGVSADDVTSVLVGDVPNIVDITSVAPSVDAVVELVDAGVGYDAGMDP